MMGGFVDESLLSTASTLNDSMASLNESIDDENDQADENQPVTKQSLCTGRITGVFDAATELSEKIASPTTTAINLEITASATDRSERTIASDSEHTTVSKLERLRAKNNLIRVKSKEKIAESRASLRKSRTISVDPTPPPNQPQPPPYPPPSVHNQVTEARKQIEEDIEMIKEFKHNPEVELSDFLRRSNAVMNQLATEIATAGSLINHSIDDGDTSFDYTKTAHTKTNDFVSNLYTQYGYGGIGKEQKSIHNEDDSLHNISVGEDWDQTTLSATSRGESSERQGQSVKAPPSRSLFNSGLPPPEVVVKRRTPGAPLRPNRAVEVSFSETTSSSFAPRAIIDRHRRKRPPSISPTVGDCVSMYNTNQKVEKLAMENDCLKRQLELLENRHRDSERKFMEHLQRTEDEEVEDGHQAGVSEANTYGYSRKKKKRFRRRIALVMLFAAVLISIVWVYRSVSTPPVSYTSNCSTADETEESDFDEIVFGETVFSDDSNDTADEEDIKLDDFDDEPDNLLVLHEPSTISNDYYTSTDNKSNSGEKKTRLERFVSRINIGHQNDLTGVWLEKHRQLTTKKHHAEL